MLNEDRIITNYPKFRAELQIPLSGEKVLSLKC
jgi:hypothetical protein